jgi:hypothetical protein
MSRPFDVLLYGEPINNAVVKFPGRRNPAVAVQADTLNNLLEQSKALVELLSSRMQRDDEIIGEAEALYEQLNDMMEGLKLEVRKAGENLDIG